MAQLMMTPGLDATLVGPLESMRGDSTDFLCLSSFQHNFGFVSWLDESAVVEQWTRLGLAGSVARPGSTPGSPRKPRVFYLQLEGEGSVASILQQLERLQQDRSVQTVDILLSPPLPKSRARPDRADGTPPIPPRPIAATVTGSVPLGEPMTGNGEGGGDTDADWEELDRLIDDLDAFDL